jgi:hypothetical protein
MSTQKLNNGPVFFSTLFSLFMILLVPLLHYLRGNPFSSNIETYLHLTQLSHPEYLFDMFIKQLVTFTSTQFVVVALPLFFAVGSLLLFILLVKPHISQTSHLCALIIVLGLTPAFIAAHIGITIYSSLLFFTLVVAYLFSKKNHLYLLFLLILFILHPVYSLFAFAYIFFLEFFKKENKHALLVFIMFIALLFFSSFFSFHQPFTFPFVFDINALFSFLGGLYGYSLFLVLLGIGGFFLYHASAKQPRQKLFHAGILILSLFFEPARLVGILLLTFYSLQGFISLISDNWHNKTLQQLTAVLFLCILLFSTMSYLNEEINRAPTIEHVQALTYLRATITQHPDHETAKILSDPSQAAFVSFFSGLDVYVDSNKELLSSQQAAFISSTLHDERIAFIFIDPYMLQGGVWQRPDEGLLFVMNYDARFKNIFDQAGYRLYYFTDWKTTSSQELV